MSQSFTYDDLNRLISATGSAYGTQTFQYDPIGNMTRKNNLIMTYGPAGLPAGSVAGPHAVTSVQRTASSGQAPSFFPLNADRCALVYDSNGNMTQRGVDSLSYDSENRLKEMKTYEAKDGSITYNLKPGWNVISFPYLPDNKSISNVLSSLTFGTDYDQVSTWDSASGTWNHFVNDSDFNDFTQFEYGKSYEIYVTKAGGVSFTVTGKSPATDISHSIKVGDNFVSPEVKQPESIASLLGAWGLALGTHLSDIKRWNASTQSFELYSQGTFTQFEPGKGYNIIGLRNASFAYGKVETTTTFVYDAAGARVKKTAGSTTTIYLGKDYDITGGVSTKYIFLGDRRIASKDSSGTALYFHGDHLNSSNVITDSSGNQAALYEYTPYGEVVTHTGSASVKHQFTGQEKDDSTGLQYFASRYYDPQLGRFITADTIVPKLINPQEFNRYSYVNNNPVKFTDPSGHKKHGFWSVFFAVVFFGPLAPVALNNPPVAAVMYGWAGYRAAQAWSKGANFRETLTAYANGIGDGVEFLENPFNAGNILKRGPTTDHFTKGTQDGLKMALDYFGCKSICGELVTASVEAGLTTGNRSYASITGSQTQSAGETLGATYVRNFLANQFYQYAIGLAARYYGFSSGSYDPSLPNNVFGVTNMLDGTIRFGNIAMASPSTLAATGWHETVHQDQFFQGKQWKAGQYALEVQAGVDTLLHASKMNLSAKDYNDEADYLKDNIGKRKIYG